MSIINQLSSQSGDRSEYSNRKVVIQCLDDPDLLSNIADGLKNRDAAIVGDCAEVMTKVAEEDPAWIVPYAGDLAMLLCHKNTRVRWEAMHALALVAALTPDTITPLLPQLTEMLRTDKSVIVRDYGTDACAAYASTSKIAAQAAYPMLKEMLTLWNGKQAGHALQGLVAIAKLLPHTHAELSLIAEKYLSFPRGVVRKAAKELAKVVEP